jgi:hypothetical protein
MESITQYQLAILECIHNWTHGPIATADIARTFANRPFSMIVHDVEFLRRHGFLSVIGDDHLSLMLAGRQAVADQRRPA